MLLRSGKNEEKGINKDIETEGEEVEVIKDHELSIESMANKRRHSAMDGRSTSNENLVLIEDEDEEDIQAYGLDEDFEDQDFPRKEQDFNVDQIMDPETNECRYPRTFLTIQSKIPSKIERKAIQVLKEICKDICESSGNYKYNEKKYNFNLALLFHFFPIFLTANNQKTFIQDMEKKLDDFLDHKKLPDYSEFPAKNMDEASSSPSSPPKKKKKKNGDNNEEETFYTDLKKKQLDKIIKCCKNGRYRKAIHCLSHGETADPSDKETYNLFLNLHPQIDCDYKKLKETLSKSDPNKNINVDLGQRSVGNMISILETLLGNLKEDKAVGPTNWNNSALKQCHKKCEYFLRALAIIAVKMERGYFPFPDLLTDSFLIGLWKNTEHTAVRPIAIANNLSKLLITAAWKYCNKYHLKNETPVLSNQFGISVSCGAELPAYIVREYYREKSLLQTISLDITNAFNSVSREEILYQVKAKAPELLPLVSLLYLHDSRLTLSTGQIIYSKQGVRQGCPLSPLLFSLAIDKVLEIENQIAKEHKAQVVAYLDDHTFIQTNTENTEKITLEEIKARIQPELQKLNLQLNEKKCYIFEPDYEEEVADKIQVEVQEDPPLQTKIVDSKKTKKNSKKDSSPEQTNNATLSKEGVVLLGIPIGTKPFIINYIQESLAEKVAAFKRLEELPTQIAFHMLRLVIAPTPVFLIRALGDKSEYFKEWDKMIEKEVFRLANQSHDYITQAELDQMDEQKKKSLEDKWDADEKEKTITRHSREEINRAKQLIDLSSRNGGLGIMTTSGIATNAFIASSINSIAILKNKNINYTISRETTKILLDFFKQPISPLDKIKDEKIVHELRNLLQDLDNIKAIRLTPNLMRGLQGKLTKIKHEITKAFFTASLDSKMFPLFEDHQGDHANRVLIKPPTMTKTFQIEDTLMQEIISQTLLLPNDFGFEECFAKISKPHGNKTANHMNACSLIGRTQTRHKNAKTSLERILKMHNHSIIDEPILSHTGTAFRGDIAVTDKNVIIDVTCVQTGQKRKTLIKAFEKAYEKKVKNYNDMKQKSVLKRDYTNNKLIPVVIGPRGQFYKKSWQDLTNLLGINNSNASKLAAKGIQPEVRNSVPPELASKTISLLKALSFRVAVDTMQSAKEWQLRQQEYWRQTGRGSQNKVVIERPSRG